MAVKLERKTQDKQLLKLVSVIDDAIDWDAMYPDETSDERKKVRYKDSYDIQELKFVEGKQPSLFVFQHPHRVEIARKIRHIVSAQIQGKVTSDMHTELWDIAYLGLQDGMDGAEREEPPRRDGHITDGFFQTLEDSGVFLELGTAFLSLAHRDRVEREAQLKK